MGLSTVIVFTLALFGASAQTCTNTNICPDGWVQVDGQCFQFNTDTMDWDSAQAKCQSQGATLYEPASVEEANQVCAYANNVGLDKFWIGVTDKAQEGTFAYASDGKPCTISNWGKNEPNNYDHGDDADGEDCAEIYPGGTWNDNTCKASDRNYICTYEVEPWIVAAFEYKKFPCPQGFTLLNDACYAPHFNSEVTYAQAQSTCESVGAKVYEPVNMNNFALIHDWVYGVYRGDIKYWLGITRQADGSFGSASTGKSLPFTFWYADEPNNAGDQENCVVVNYHDDGVVEGQWNDWTCTHEARFICELPLPSFEVKMKEV